MKYIFDKVSKDNQHTFDIVKGELTEEEVNYCLTMLPNLEIIAPVSRTYSFSMDSEGWFTNHVNTRRKNTDTIVTFKEVFGE